MQLVKKVSLDINKKVYQEIKAKQNDIGRFIEFTLFSDGIALNITGNTVKIYGNKPDGKIIFNNLTILDYAKGIVLAELTNQALAKPGTLNAELVIYGADGTEISSIPFGINVIKSIRNDSAIESQNEFTALSEAMQSLVEYDTYKQKVNDLELDKLDKNGDSKDNTVTFAIAETETDIVSGEKHSTLFGKIAKSISTFRSAIGVLASLSTVNKNNLVAAINELASGKISITDITQTAETNSATKVPSSAVTNGLQTQVTTLNNNLAKQSGSQTSGFELGFTSSIQDCRYSKTLGIIVLSYSISFSTPVTSQQQKALTLPTGFRPSNTTFGLGLINGATVCQIQINSSGEMYINALGTSIPSGDIRFTVTFT